MKTVNGASLYAPAVYGPAGRILCTVYTAEGNGPHPVLIFTHGYPGHEKNLDLAQSLRRTGFSSVIFFYRGCWGSEGDFSFEGSFEDTKAFTRHRRSIVRYKRFRKYKSIFETQKNHKSTNEDRRYTRE